MSKTYLVGGALRDEMLGLPVKERDWVVVGASPQHMIALGFQPVGKDFPVFLHPETHEEYALARTERKIGKGYKGFTFHSSPDITLEEDLLRRDLTINAMARSPEGTLIDPYGGQLDLQRCILRHVSPAFSEDPVRILRVARFAAKLPHFTVHPETNHLMKTMVTSGEVDALVPERVWQELSSALKEEKPIRFFEVLSDCGALPILFPMLKINSQGMRALERVTLPQATEACLKKVRFASLLHDIETNQVSVCCKRYPVPKEFFELAQLANLYTKEYAPLLEATAQQLLDFIKKTDALRRNDRFKEFLQVARFCVPDNLNEQRVRRLQHALGILQEIKAAPLVQAGLKGQEIAQKLHQLQLAALEAHFTQIKDC